MAQPHQKTPVKTKTYTIRVRPASTGVDPRKPMVQAKTIANEERFHSTRARRRKIMFGTSFLVSFFNRFFEQLVMRENFQKYSDRLFDLIEEMIEDSETSWDDRVMLPLLQMVKNILGGAETE
jgi:hypothetical protein